MWNGNARNLKSHSNTKNKWKTLSTPTNEGREGNQNNEGERREGDNHNLSVDISAKRREASLKPECLLYFEREQSGAAKCLSLKKKDYLFTLYHITPLFPPLKVTYSEYKDKTRFWYRECIFPLYTYVFGYAWISRMRLASLPRGWSESTQAVCLQILARSFWSQEVLSLRRISTYRPGSHGRTLELQDLAPNAREEKIHNHNTKLQIRDNIIFLGGKYKDPVSNNIEYKRLSKIFWWKLYDSAFGKKKFLNMSHH